jgi:hypothetical protein
MRAPDRTQRSVSVRPAERNRATAERRGAPCSGCAAICDECATEQERDELRAERDLLAAALRDIAGGDYANAPARAIARRALADAERRKGPST